MIPTPTFKDELSFQQSQPSEQVIIKGYIETAVYQNLCESASNNSPLRYRSASSQKLKSTAKANEEKSKILQQANQTLLEEMEKMEDLETKIKQLNQKCSDLKQENQALKEQLKLHGITSNFEN